VTITGRDAAGNEVALSLSMTVPDNTVPIYYVVDVLGNILADNDPTTAPGTSLNFGTVAIPEGECSRQDEYYVYGFDNCDGFITATDAVSATATTIPATSVPGTQVSTTADGFGFTLVDVHWSTGASTVTITGRDAAGNTVNLTLQMTVPDNVAPVIIANSENASISACQIPPFYQNYIYSFTISDDCEPINISSVQFNGGGSGLPNLNGSGFYYTQVVGPNTVYFEVLGNVGPAGTYFPTITYNGVMASPTITVDQNANQPADIVWQAVQATIPVCASSVEETVLVWIYDDCDSPIDPARATFTLNGVPLTPAVVNAGTGYFELHLVLTAANNGQLLVATYIDAHGAVRTVSDAVTVGVQADTWAPIIIYPAQDIIVNLSCGVPTAMIFFEASAFDNCQLATFVVSVMPGGQILTPGNVGMYEVTLPPGTHTITLTATDLSGNVRQEDFRIIVNALPEANFTATPVPGTCGHVGRIEVSNISGAAPFTIIWTGPVSGSATTSSNTYNINNLPSGSYNVTVTGANQCSSQASVALSNLPNTLSFDASPSPGSCGQYGSILLQIFNDAGPYVITWSGPVSGSSATSNQTFTISNVPDGTYSVSVAGQCVNDPVSTSVTMQNVGNTSPPVIYVTDALGNLLADNDPGTSAGMNHHFGATPTSATSCALSETYYISGFDDCDDFLSVEGAIGAYVSVNSVATQVITTPGAPGFYEIHVFWGVGNSSIVINGRDLSGNETPDIVISRNLTDNTPPVLACSDHSVVFNGQASIALNPNDLVTASDNCGIQSIVLTPNTILSNQVGQVAPVTVTATDLNGNTAQCVSHITVTGLPSGWTSDSVSIGGVTTVTTYNPATGEWDVTATGGFYGPPYDSDALAFTHRTLCGNGSITALVTDISGGQGWAGVVMRETNNPGSKKAQLLTNMGPFSRREFRIETDGAAYPQQFPSQSRYWLRIVRTGAQFSLFTSANGQVWYPAGAQSIQMNECIQMGLVVTNYTANSTVTATFSNVSYTGSATPGLVGAGIPDQALDMPEHVEFSIFPNPTTGNLNLDLVQYMGRQVRIEVYSLQGELLRFSEVPEVHIHAEALDLSGFADGMYLIRVKSPGWPDAVQRAVLVRRN
jgi:hypothetical protein